MRGLLRQLDANREMTLAGVIVAVWVGTVAISVFSRSYMAPPTVNAAMMAAAGFVFSRGYIDRQREKNGD